MRLKSSGVRVRSPFGGIFGGLVMVLLGLGFAYFGWTSRASALEFIEASSSAAGRVVQVDTKRNSDGDILFYPVIEFTTAGGETIQFRSSTGTNPPAYNVGDQVEVLYDPNLPQNARENSFSGLWMLPTILLVFGGLFTLIGVLGFFNSIATILGIGGLLGIGAWLLMRGKKEESQEESGG